MPEISRRRFIRNASMGAAAVGVAAAGGTTLFSSLSGAAAVPMLAAADTPKMEGSGIIAHVDDAKTGAISIFVGNRTINYVDVGLAQKLMQAAQ
jgi:hypothetical protein